MLSSNIEEYDINIDINISEKQTIVVNLSKKTGYLTIIDDLNPISGKSYSLTNLEILKEFNQPIILPDNLNTFYIDENVIYIEIYVEI